MQGLVLGWRTGMTQPAHTFMLEVAGDELWFGYLGKGGAHWEPGMPRYLRSGNSLAGDIGGDAGLGIGRVGHMAGAAMGLAAGKAVLSKFQKEIDENVERFMQEGRPALSTAKQTWAAPKSDFVGAELVEKMPLIGPPALRGMGPYIKAKVAGKSYYIVITPDTGVAAPELLAMLQ